MKRVECVPWDPPLGQWRAPTGDGDPNVEDEEVTFQGGMGTQQANTTTHKPPHTEENVGHLLSTLATGLRLGTPRINTYSGNATP